MVRRCMACRADLRSGNTGLLCSVCDRRYLLYRAQFVPGGKKFTERQYACKFHKMGQALVRIINTDTHDELEERPVEEVKVHAPVRRSRRYGDDLDI